MSDSVQPQRWQPTRLPRPGDSPGKNTGVGCHFLLQCMKVKSESEVTQSCPTLATPWTAAYQAPLSMGFSRQEYWSALAPPILELIAQWKWVLTRIMESRATKGGVLLMEVVSFSFYIISTWFFYPEKFLDAGVAVFKHIILGCAEERVVLYSVFQNPIMRRDLCKLISKIFKS